LNVVRCQSPVPARKRLGILAGEAAKCALELRQPSLGEGAADLRPARARGLRAKAVRPGGTIASSASYISSTSAWIDRVRRMGSHGAICSGSDGNSRAIWLAASLTRASALAEPSVR